MKHLRLTLGIILVVTSLLKLAAISGIVSISWLERISNDGPVATYCIPLILILVGTDLIRQGRKD